MLPLPSAVAVEVAVAVAVAATQALTAAAAAVAVAVADWRALRLHYTLLQLLRSNFMSFLGTKSYKTARNCLPSKRDS